MALKRLFPVLQGSNLFDGIIEVTPDEGLGVSRPITDGQADPYVAATIAAFPKIGWTTLAIAKALGFVGFASAVGDITAYDQKIGEDGEAASGNVHTKYVLSSALTVPRTLTIPERGDASISYEAMGYGTGSTLPLTSTDNQALGSYTPGNEELFGLGPVKINGTTIGSIVSISINFGFGLFMEPNDGKIWPKDCKVLSRLPVITITTLDTSAALSARGSGGRGSLCLDGTNGCELWAKKRACGGYVADATAEHVKIQALDGVARVGTISGSPRRAVIIVEPRRESTGSLIIDTTAAIA